MSESTSAVGKAGKARWLGELTAAEKADGWRWEPWLSGTALYPPQESEDNYLARITYDGWRAYESTNMAAARIDEGSETDAAGMSLAIQALREAELMARVPAVAHPTAMPGVSVEARRLNEAAERLSATLRDSLAEYAKGAAAAFEQFSRTIQEAIDSGVLTVPKLHNLGVLPDPPPDDPTFAIRESTERLRDSLQPVVDADCALRRLAQVAMDAGVPVEKITAAIDGGDPRQPKDFPTAIIDQCRLMTQAAIGFGATPEQLSEAIAELTTSARAIRMRAAAKGTIVVDGDLIALYDTPPAKPAEMATWSEPASAED